MWCDGGQGSNNPFIHYHCHNYPVPVGLCHAACLLASRTDSLRVLVSPEEEEDTHLIKESSFIHPVITIPSTHPPFTSHTHNVMMVVCKKCMHTIGSFHHQRVTCRSHIPPLELNSHMTETHPPMYISHVTDCPVRVRHWAVETSRLLT